MTDCEFLMGVTSNRCKWGARDIPRAQQLRDEHGLCEYVCNPGVCGWWQVTDTGKKYIREHRND